MDYIEIPASVPGLACFWVRTVETDGAARILPDACWDLIWRGGDAVQLAGPDTRAWQSSLTRGDTIVGARFATGTGTALGFPLAEVRDHRVPFLQLPDVPADPLQAMAGLAARLLRERGPDPAVAEAARRLSDPRQRVDSLAADLGLSERQLRRRFQAAAGYGPKTLQRILRFRRFLSLTDGDLSRRAAEAGYADQSHLTHDCGELAGLTPAALLADRAAAA